MEKKITILTTLSSLPHKSDGEHVGLLLECPADAEFFPKNNHVISMDQLIGHAEEARRLACELASKLTINEPPLRGIPQLTVFHEVLSAELHKIFHIVHLYRFLENNHYTVCTFLQSTWWGNELYQLAALKKSKIKIEIPLIRKQNKIIKLFYKLMESKFALAVMYIEFKKIINYVDFFHRRSMLFKKFVEKYEKNKIWFYSTANNYTNIGLSYEPFFPEPFHYLIENKSTGGKSLLQNKRMFTSCYEFALPDFIPDHDERKQAVQMIYHHLLQVPLLSEESIVREMFLKSTWLKLFFSRLLAYGLFLAAVFENWINKTAPKAVIVGNQVFEGYALYKARDKNIPTVLLQHGVVANYYSYSDHPVDYYIVRGKFFYDRLSQFSKKRAVIFNPTHHVDDTYVTSKKKFIVFLTLPTQVLTPAVEVDIKSVLQTLLQTISTTSMELVIRVHPLEKIIDYKLLVDSILKNTMYKCNIHYHQGNGLHELLKNTAAVVMLHSTVFLDCLKHQVPIISFNWHQFGWKETIKPYEIFFFAENLSHLAALILQAHQGKLILKKQTSAFFLAEIARPVFFNELKKMLRITMDNESTL